ncbi:hypothetical protein [Sulfurimonas sp.]|uniref:hypothetical protein n=1 Tax=Sulfurimonas sp. TaxID=2022749 RepID=UPI0025E82328|nr:hypothetical protein [Sulfurimonas sp.]
MSDLQIILSEISSLKKQLDIFVPDLTLEKEVIHFLAKDKRTFKRYLDENYLEEGIHYYNDYNKRVYIPDAIVAFKKSGCRPPITNPESQAVLKKLGL